MGFIKTCPNPVYREMFTTSFTQKKKEMWLSGRDLVKYQTKQQRSKRKKEFIDVDRAFVIWERGFGVKRDARCRLYLLLRIVYRYLTWGSLQGSDHLPPWYPGDDMTLDATSKELD